METKRMIGKSLQPARPVRHLTPYVSPTNFSFQTMFSCSTPVHSPNEIGSICKSNRLLVLNESLIPRVSEQHKPEVTKERITYSRDYLLKLSEVSLAQEKPEFLPDHPVVLEKPMPWSPTTAATTWNSLPVQPVGFQVSPGLFTQTNYCLLSDSRNDVSF
ncbi:uncharacterized protein C8orf88 homolog isoform X2 [Anolis carolinensis]|uniref:Chromosome 8 open reading frame 88 n=1 Tax=Anolis carolinensis TaxID=28377 RepID=A0A803TGT1_ANOCA|nr:PREDICTED: uncharacterized protein C8orf88 homolog isoform X2 [Anolis carolinensis]XP_008106610.1 PREDICTED: uncharacterized protein C8orf88 homolog isoform X2 [Anolis carolinensis]|eukprot:XP_003219577.1 PREDICTED: uncharacterized protein C8orf88 homolog isoform X2 [Anolis carolinensis]